MKRFPAFPETLKGLKVIDADTHYSEPHEPLDVPSPGLVPRAGAAHRMTGTPGYVARSIQACPDQPAGPSAACLRLGYLASDLPAVMFALPGTIVACGPSGERTIAADDFFVEFSRLCSSPTRSSRRSVSPRRAMPVGRSRSSTTTPRTWPSSGIAAVGGPLLGVALVNTGSTPVRAVAVQQALRAGASPAEAARAAADGTEPPSDLNVSAEYRCHLARVLVERALATVAEGTLT